MLHLAEAILIHRSQKSVFLPTLHDNVQICISLLGQRLSRPCLGVSARLALVEVTQR